MPSSVSVCTQGSRRGTSDLEPVRIATRGGMTLVRVEVRPQIVFEDVSACLSEYRVQCPGVKLCVLRNGDGLLSRRRCSSEFGMAAPLGDSVEPEFAKDSDYFPQIGRASC